MPLSVARLRRSASLFLAAGIGLAGGHTAHAQQGAPSEAPQGSSVPFVEGTVGERFVSLSHMWSMEFPEGWRQLSPKETNTLRDQLPEDMHLSQPMRLYAMGQVDQWLDTGFDGICILVVEVADEAIHDDTLPITIAKHWREQSNDTYTHRVSDIREITIGKDDHKVLQAVRDTSGKGKEWRALDLYVPTGGKEVILSFRTPKAEFEAWEPTFRSWIATASFAHPPRGEASVFDIMFWPLFLGGTVALGLIFGYRASRRTQLPSPPPLGVDPEKPV